jgi:hypothetical protein
MKAYDIVRVIRIRDDRFNGQRPNFHRHPQVGDIGTIVMDYDHGTAFEVECCEDGSAVTIWLSAMFPDELELVSTHNG